ncbi:MAG: hypothetical protein D6782_02885 [Alphaproteobacteria bacterium]|nr:MAG: hypothetical protein D6782_02885 [Alphaproteobacteria bacterium]
MRPEYRLKLRLRDFNAAAAEPSGATMVAVRFTALLIPTHGPEIMAQREIALSRPASADNAAAVVTALDALFGEATVSLVGWTLEQTAQQHAATR